MIIKQLKQLHHRYLVWKMIHKHTSLFGNAIQIVVGGDRINKRINFIPSITIVVLMHNNRQIIKKCIDSLIAFNDYNYEIIVVDNQSTDGSAEVIKDEVNIITNQVNGCASGRNLGAKQAKSEYLLFIDSDQGPIAHNWLDMYISILQSSDIGAVGYHGGFLTQDDLTGPSLSHFPGMLQPYRTNIDYLESGGLFISKQLFEAIGGFDERYDPHGFEDTDLSRKIVASGKLIAYCPSLLIYHDAHSTTKADEGNADYLAQFAKNAVYFRSKWLEAKT